jgi:DNA-directed RNA polymerase subunit RPC12/RpoP
MSQWMLTCSTCGKEFTHSSIPENLPFVQLDLPHKPEFPQGGLAFDCPHCRESATYQRHDLIYRLSPAVQVQ